MSGRHIEATPLTPRHMCRLVLPPKSKASSTTNLNDSTSTGASGRPSNSTVSSLHRGHGSTTSLSSYSSAHTKTTIGISNVSENMHPLKRVPSYSSASSRTSHGKGSSQNQHNISNGSNNNGFAPVARGCIAPPNDIRCSSPIMIAFSRYLLVPSSDGRLHIYEVTDTASSCILNEETLSKRGIQIQPKRDDLFEPVCSIGPFFAGQEFNSKDRSSNVMVASIVDLCATQSWKHDTNQANEQNIPISRDSLLGYVGLLTSEGDVHILEFRLRLPSGIPSDMNHSDGRRGSLRSTTQNEYHFLSVRVLSSICTGELTGSCITFHRFSKKYTSVEQEPSDKEKVAREKALVTKSNLLYHVLHVAIGYHSGSVHYVQISIPDMESMNNSNVVDQPSEGRRGAHLSQIHVSPEIQLIWKGKFKYPIQSVSSLGGRRTSTRKDVTDLHGKESFLIVGLAHEARGTSTCSAIGNCVEVINLQSIIVEWKGKENPLKNPIVLENHVVWPAPMKEIRDISICPKGKMPKNVNFVKPPDKGNKGTTSSFAHEPALPHAVSAMCAFEGADPAISVAISNGSIIILHSMINETTTELEWGCLHNDNQTLLSSPCIGLGRFDRTEFDGNICTKDSQTVACCTRNGTVFMLPVMTMDQCDEAASGSPHPDKSVVMYQCPFDRGSDSFARYLQGFTAGYLQKTNSSIITRSPRVHDDSLSGDRHDDDMLPVLCFAWAGGFIDVYTCGRLRGGEASSATKASIPLSDSYSNKCVQDLLSALLEISQKQDMKFDNLMVCRAAQECKNFPGSLSDIVDKLEKEPRCENLEHTRLLIHHLVLGSPVV